MPKIGANDVQSLERGHLEVTPPPSLYQQLGDAIDRKAGSAQALKDMVRVAYDKGYEDGYREGFDNCLREIREALYKLYGGSMVTQKEKADARRKD